MPATSNAPEPNGTPRVDLDLSTGLACLVDRVRQNKQPWVVVTTAALEAWEHRDPAGWEKVSEWLAENGVTVVRI